LAVVGESGCGKSTLARLLTMIETPTAGRLRSTAPTCPAADKRPAHGLAPAVQIVFQNPYGSLNPRQKIGHALEEPLLVNGRFTAESAKPRRAMMTPGGPAPEH
jgi:dipeptide transport system ATP-binding protein